MLVWSRVRKDPVRYNTITIVSRSHKGSVLVAHAQYAPAVFQRTESSAVIGQLRLQTNGVTSATRDG